jgi:hypothetical protein
VDLDNTKFETREAASKELSYLGIEAEPALRAALTESSRVETRKRIEAILSNPAPPKAGSPEILRRLRAIQVLEYIGSEPAREMLDRLKGGAAGALETRDAGDALARLRQKRAP